MITQFSMLGKLILDAADNYNKKYPPGVEINFNLLGYADTVEALANQRLDIVFFEDMLYDEIATAARQGLLTDLTRMNAQEVDVFNHLTDYGMVDSGLFAFPFAAFPRTIFYRKNIFDDANLSYPQGDWTWEQFRELSRKIDSNSGLLSGSSMWFTMKTLEGLAFSMGGKGVISPDQTTTVGYLDSPEMVRAVQWLQAYTQDDPRKEGGYSHVADHKAMWTVEYDICCKLYSDEESTNAPWPHFEGYKKSTPTLLNAFGIASRSEHPQEAWAFMKYLTLEVNEDSIKFAEGTKMPHNYRYLAGFIPTSRPLAEAIRLNANLITQHFIDEMDYAVKAFTIERPRPSNPFMIDIWNEELQSLLESLPTASDVDLPELLHTLALKIDEQIQQLNETK